MPSDPKLFYGCHVFCCTNVRPEGHPRGSCARKNAVELRNYMKDKAKEMGLKEVRINTAGCLDRCELVLKVAPPCPKSNPVTPRSARCVTSPMAARSLPVLRPRRAGA